jgi:hypothetical protein
MTQGGIMTFEWLHARFIETLEGIIVVGTALTAIGYGLKRVYNTARGVEKILEFTVKEKAAREQLAVDLAAHIKAGNERDAQRSLQISELVDTVREISRETRPNGGSSMKDVLNHTAERVGDIHTRVAVLEEWKRLTKG